ncbi:hypothetical protein B0H16DRAFT_1884043 [Mycena metata]|uniref:DUF6534 domain-containing protein n=1 Tax=Mycena metata TaxID=1033252 RepID=A0AAD7NJA9_9AGAR|nr:hypothetical protein B0H16DRAFT_1884043 [Mycena metata]
MAGTGVELLFGPMLIGVLLSTALYGVMVVQMLVYYQTYPTDARWIRYFLLYLFIVETVDIAVQIGVIYEPLIVRYGLRLNPPYPTFVNVQFQGTQNALITSPLLLPGVAISLVMASTPIQLFTAWRISVITESIVVPFLISALSLVSFVGASLVTYFVTIRNEFVKFQSFSWAVVIWLISAAIVDVVIAAKLTHSLTQRRTGFSAMDGQINRVVRLTVQTGAITALCALVDVILFLVFPHTTLQFIVDFPLAKLYVLCLLSTLNARSRGRVRDVERMPNALFKEDTTMTSMSTTAPSQVQTHLSREPTVRTMQTLYPPPPNMYAAPTHSPTDTLVDRQKSTLFDDQQELESHVRIAYTGERPRRI